MTPYDFYDTVFVERAGDALGFKFSGDDLTRAIRITPFDGAYGIAGYTVAIEGTPPRGVFVLTAPNCGSVLTGTYGGKMRQATEHSGSIAMKDIRTYLMVHLNKFIEHDKYR